MTDAYVSPLVPAGVGAAGEVLRAPESFWYPNWADGLVLRSSFATSAVMPISIAENRRGYRARPLRSFEYTTETASSRAGEAFALQAAAARAAQSRTIVPLYCDLAPVTAAAAAGATTLACDTADRRFFPGARVLLHRVAAGTLRIRDFQVLEIAAGGLSAGSLTFTSVLASAVDRGWRVAPIFEADLVPRLSYEIRTGAKVRFRHAWLETPGPTALPPIQEAGTVPAGVGTYAGYPIFNLAVDWRGVQAGVARIGGYTGVGRGRVLQTRGRRAPWSASVPVYGRGRSAAMGVVRFFESRAGQLYPFWFPDLTAQFRPVSIDGASITLRPAGELLDWEFLDYLAIVLTDGTLIIRGRGSVVRAAAGDRFYFDTPIGSVPDLSRIARVCAARLSRFDSDELVETWSNDARLTSTLQVTELLEERSVTLGIATPDGEAATARADITSCCPGFDGDEEPQPPTPGPEFVRYVLCGTVSGDPPETLDIQMHVPWDPLAPFVRVKWGLWSQSDFGFDGREGCYRREIEGIELEGNEETERLTYVITAYYDTCDACAAGGGGGGGDEASVRYDPCQGTGGGPSIYLPPGTTAESIKVGGQCYERIGEALGVAPDTAADDIQATYADCEACDDGPVECVTCGDCCMSKKSKATASWELSGGDTTHALWDQVASSSDFFQEVVDTVLAYRDACTWQLVVFKPAPAALLPAIPSIRYTLQVALQSFTLQADYLDADGEAVATETLINTGNIVPDPDNLGCCTFCYPSSCVGTDANNGELGGQMHATLGFTNNKCCLCDGSCAPTLDGSVSECDPDAQRINNCAEPDQATGCSGPPPTCDECGGSCFSSDSTASGSWTWTPDTSSVTCCTNASWTGNSFTDAPRYTGGDITMPTISGYTALFRVCGPLSCPQAIGTWFEPGVGLQTIEANYYRVIVFRNCTTGAWKIRFEWWDGDPCAGPVDMAQFIDYWEADETGASDATQFDFSGTIEIHGFCAGTLAGAVSIENNRCCKCAGGGCVPTSDGSVNTAANNACTSSQDDDCPA